MTKSRVNTENRILLALEALLLDQGHGAVGVNVIARQAGCDKVLIYRYFDGLDGLLIAFAQTRELWWEIDEIILEEPADCAIMTLPDYLDLLLTRYVVALESRPLTLEIMAWEMSAQNNLTNALAATRRQRGIALVKQIRRLYPQPSIDIGGILGVFGAAINYLVMRTRNQTRQYRTEEWWRLQTTITGLIQSLSHE